MQWGPGVGGGRRKRESARPRFHTPLPHRLHAGEPHNLRPRAVLGRSTALMRAGLRGTAVGELTR